MDEPKQEQTERKPVPEILRQAGMAGLGLLAVAGEGVTRGFQYLVERGEQLEPLARERMGAARDRIRETAGRSEKAVDEKVSAALKRFGVPTREQLQAFTEKLDQLASRVDELAQHRGS